MFGSFSNKYVKIATSEWEALKQEMANLKATNETLRLMQSPLLKKQVEDLEEKLAQYKVFDAQDEKLYQMEQANQDKLQRIRELEAQVEDAEYRARKAEDAYNKEKNISSLLAEHYSKTKHCETYKTVSRYDIYA